jgi:hypothetical protein
LSERLAFHSQPDGDCVVFTGYRDKNGYGKMTVLGRDVGAHRVAYELACGPIPGDLVVRHKCDNPPCIKPEHLEIGTHADNGGDKAIRDRSTHGERNPGAKLSESQVVEILQMLRDGVAQRQIAAKFDVGQSTIGRIKRGEAWRRTLERVAA